MILLFHLFIIQTCDLCLLPQFSRRLMHINLTSLLTGLGVSKHSGSQKQVEVGPCCKTKKSEIETSGHVGVVIAVGSASKRRKKILRLNTCIHVFMGNMLSLYQKKNEKLSQI